MGKPRPEGERRPGPQRDQSSARRARTNRQRAAASDHYSHSVARLDRPHPVCCLPSSITPLRSTNMGPSTPLWMELPLGHASWMGMPFGPARSALANPD
jgi:hypothetical protein